MNSQQLPGFTLVVPSLNQGRYLAEALDSVLDHAYPRLELFVMDAGSTDETRDVIERFADRLDHWRSAPDAGQAAAVNEGVARGTGDLVGWLNADDRLEPDALWHVARAWVAHPGHGLYVGNGFREIERLGGERRPFCRRHLAFDRDALRHGVDYLLQPAVFVSREAWQAAGGLREELHYCMDWDLYQRVSANASVVLVNEFLATSREHGATKTQGGGFARIEEICALSRRHGDHVSPGALHYALETLLFAIDPAERPLREAVERAMGVALSVMGERWQAPDGFPRRQDSQDVVHVPRAGPGVPVAPAVGTTWPSLGVVLASTEDARAVSHALSVEGAATVEAVVVGRESPRPARSPARAGGIEAGGQRLFQALARVSGDVVTWLPPGCALAAGAWPAVARAFAGDPGLDLVWGNALFVDGTGRVAPPPGDPGSNALVDAWLPDPDRAWRYWEAATPPPAVFVRRSLVASPGAAQAGSTTAWMARAARHARTRKLDTVVWLCPPPLGDATAEGRRRLAGDYRSSRPCWPSLTTAAGRDTLVDFVRAFVRRRHGAGTKGLRSWALAVVAGSMAAVRIGNPERLPRPLAARQARLEP